MPRATPRAASACACGCSSRDGIDRRRRAFYGMDCATSESSGARGDTPEVRSARNSGARSARNTMRDTMRLLIAGGGTGGHLFPGVALAEELRARDPGAQVRFVGTARGIEARVLPKLGWDLDLIDVSGLKTVGALGAMRGVLRLPRALWQARRVVKQFAPDAVIGVGGYASGPVVLMARLGGIPTAICEQNSIPGLTNKILGRVARSVFVSFDRTRQFFKPRKTVVSGNPVRRELVQRLLGDAPAPAAPETHHRVHVLVSGGSLGAVAVNDLAAQALIA